MTEPSFAWSLNDMFIDWRLDPKISFGATIVDVFDTTVLEVNSAFQQRLSHRDEPLVEMNLGYELKTMEELHTLRALGRACLGQSYSFRVKDWTDYTSSIPVDRDARKPPPVTAFDQPLEAYQSSTTVYQMKKEYTFGPVTRTRTITKPVDGTVLVGINGVGATEGVDYTVDHLTGLVTFASPSPVNPTWGGEFDVPMRLKSDETAVRLTNIGIGELPDVFLIEVRMHEE